MRVTNQTFFVILILGVMLIDGCEQPAQKTITEQSQDFAKEELQQLLKKSSEISVFDISYKMQMTVLDKNLFDITTRQIKQGNNQKLDSYGTVLGFQVSTTSVMTGGRQVTCGIFDNKWECSAGSQVCKETPKGKLCQSVSQEGFPNIKPEQLKDADVTKAGIKQLLGMSLQCYNLKTKQSGQEALMEVCINQDGLIILLQSEAKGAQVKIEAKSFSTAIYPNAFELPAQLG